MTISSLELYHSVFFVINIIALSYLIDHAEVFFYDATTEPKSDRLRLPAQWSIWPAEQAMLLLSTYILRSKPAIVLAHRWRSCVGYDVFSMAAIHAFVLATSRHSIL